MRKFLNGIVSTIGALFGAFWLLVLYGFTIWLSIGTLTAIQLRADLNANLVDGQPAVSFSDVKRAADSYDEQIDLIYQRRSAAYKELNDASVDYYFEVDQNMLQIAASLGIEPETVDPVAFSNGPAFAAAEERCTAPLNGLATNAANPVCDLINNHYALLSDATKRNDSLQSYEFISQTSENIRQRISEIDRQIEKIREGEPLSKHFDAYRFMSDRLGYANFLHMPQHVLVLFLTMAMGMLGSVVTMTWLFIRQDSSLSVRRFVILPFIGTMSAVIVLIFISAGQLTLTAGESQDSLNPFVLSFVGIISGLLSERAYTRISEVGSGFFAVDDGQPRWGFRLREALETVGVSVPELARHLGTTEEEAGRIVSESTTATLTQQRLIAACVRRNVRELFTDVPPDGPHGAAADPQVIMPDLTGLDPKLLEKVMGEFGLRLGERAEAPAEGVAAGLVMAQSPSPGSRVPRRTRVAYTIAVAPLDLSDLADDAVDAVDPEPEGKA